MEGDDPRGRPARVTAHIGPGELGEVVIGFGSRTDTYVAAGARGESFDVGETVVVVTVTAGKHVLVSAFS